MPNTCIFVGYTIRNEGLRTFVATDPQHTLHSVLPLESTITYNLRPLAHNLISPGFCMPIVIYCYFILLSCHVCSCGLSSA